ncbi:MAG: DUF952 domain-containing protein [Pseudomonadota bacterium]
MADVVKVLRAAELSTFRMTGVFEGSPDDLRDGFIHLSTPSQVAGTLARHFCDADGTAETALTALVLDTSKLGENLRWERSRDGAQFPHLYRALVLDDVVATHEIAIGDDGRHCLAAERHPDDGADT